MKKKYPPRLYAYKTIAGDWWATEKRQFGDHNIKADFEKLLPLMTIEEHDALITPLIEALQYAENLHDECCPDRWHENCNCENREIKNALKNYKKQTSKNND